MRRIKYLFLGIVIIALVVWASFYSASIFNSTSSIKSDSPFMVEEGESLHSLSERLEEAGYIKSALWFRVWVSVLGRDRDIQLGGYNFTESMTLYGVVKKLAYGKPDTPLASITIPEGSTLTEITEIAKKQLPNFSPSVFSKNVSNLEANGRLFPSTYYLLPSTTESRLIEIMTETFDDKFIESFGENIDFPRPLKNRDDVINLAALLEGEAQSKEDMQIVAGILLERLNRGMRLQADAAPETYDHAGLPYLPINNPGLTSLFAALNPIPSPYLYYLHAQDGTMYFAKTFEEHRSNIKKYLK